MNKEEVLKKLESLTAEERKELNALKTAEEVRAFFKRIGIELSNEQALELAAALPDDALNGVGGGFVPGMGIEAGILDKIRRLFR